VYLLGRAGGRGIFVACVGEPFANPGKGQRQRDGHAGLVASLTSEAHEGREAW